MSEEFRDKKNIIPNTTEKQADNNNIEEKNNSNGNRVIDEANYQIRAPRESGPTAIGRGGDPLFRRIQATPEQLKELMEETQTVQDWVQRETCNNVALGCLESENLKDIYYKIKDGFGEYGKISLMGFKTPSGVEIPRLKIFGSDGEVLEVLTGPLAIDELNKRALAYNDSMNNYEVVPDAEAIIETGVIGDYSGNPNDYIT